MDGLLIGAIAALVAAPRAPLSSKRLAWWMNALLLLVSGVLPFIQHMQAWLYYGGFTLIACAMAVLVTAAAHAPPHPLLAHRAAIWVGKRSYGIYLFHVPIFLALENFRRLNSPLNLMLATMLRFALTFASRTCPIA